MSEKPRIFKVHQIPKKQCINSAVYLVNTGIICCINGAILEWQKMQRNILLQQSWEHWEFADFEEVKKESCPAAFWSAQSQTIMKPQSADDYSNETWQKTSGDIVEQSMMQSQTTTSVRTLKTDQKSRPGTRKIWHWHHEDAFLYDCNCKLESEMNLKSSSLSFQMAKKKSKNASSLENSQREHVTSMQKRLLRIHKSITTNSHLAWSRLSTQTSSQQHLSINPLIDARWFQWSCRSLLL